MEIIWTYNFLEIVAFIGIVLIGLYMVIKGIEILALWIFWGRNR